MRRWLLALCLLPLLVNAADAPQAKAPSQPKVTFETSLGKIVIALDAAKAPQSVANFLQYVRDGSYNNSLFHRVIPGFVVQGGGYDSHYQSLPTRSPVQNESNNGLSNLRGTLAMARTADPDSATRQFYFNLRDNKALDGNLATSGYTVFGKVTQGLDVLDAIAAKPTEVSPVLGAPDVPVEPILITKATISQ
mgnify:CR=1 FL=1